MPLLNERIHRASRLRELYMVTTMMDTGVAEFQPHVEDPQEAIDTFVSKARERGGQPPLNMSPADFNPPADPALYFITVEHGHTTSHKGPELATFEEAETMLMSLEIRDKPLIHDTGIIDHSQPIYRLWRVLGRSTIRQGPRSVGVALWQLVSSRPSGDLG